MGNTLTQPAPSTSPNGFDIEAVYRTKFKSLTAFAYQVTGQWQDAEDAVQEAFIHVLKDVDNFKPDGGDDNRSGRAWVATVAKYRAMHIRHLRHSRRERFAPRHATDTTGVGDWLDYAAFGRETLERNDASDSRRSDLRKKVMAALAELPPEHREVLELCVLNGMKRRDAADELGLTENTVKMRRFHAILYIKRVLDGQPAVYRNIPSPAWLAGLERFRAEQRKLWGWVAARQDMLSLLTNRQRDVFLLSYIDGLTASQISERLDISISSVYNHRLNATARIRGALAEQERNQK